MASKKEIAVPQSLFPQELPEEAKGKGRGNEEVGSDLARPIIKLLQALSPQLNPGLATFVEGAKVGQFFNTVTGDVVDELFVSNLYYYKNWAVFQQQDFGGGFEGNYDSKEIAATFISDSNFNPEQYDIIETAHHILAIIDTDSGEVEPAEFLMSGTKLSISRTWNANIKSKGGDRFSSVWKLSSAMVTKGQNTWSQVIVDLAGFTPPDLHAICAASYQEVVDSFTSERKQT